MKWIVMKKPIEVVAEQWIPGVNDIPEVVNYSIKTKEGTMIISPGDWVITGMEGEKYVCDCTIFFKSYNILKPVEDING